MLNSKIRLTTLKLKASHRVLKHRCLILSEHCLALVELQQAKTLFTSTQLQSVTDSPHQTYFSTKFPTSTFNLSQDNHMPILSNHSSRDLKLAPLLLNQLNPNSSLLSQDKAVSDLFLLTKE